MAKPQEDIFKPSEKLTYVLIDRVKNRVWHEQYPSRAEAQAKIDYEKNENGIVGNWEIEVIYPKKEHAD